MGTISGSELAETGGARRDRTADLLHAMQALSQLSYSPKNSGETLREARKAVKNATGG